MSAVSIDVDVLSDLPAKTLLKLVEQAQRVKKNMDAQQRTVKDFPSLFRQLEEWEIEIGFDVAYGDINLSFNGDGSKFGDVWGLLRANGYVPSERPKKGDTSFMGGFKLPEDRREGYARIWLSFSSTMCKRVKVGTRERTIVEDVYETRCEGGLPEIKDAGEEPAQLSAPSEESELESAF